MVRHAAICSVLAFLTRHRFLASTIIFVAMLRRLDYRKQGLWVPHEEEVSG